MPHHVMQMQLSWLMIACKLHHERVPVRKPVGRLHSSVKMMLNEWPCHSGTPLTSPTSDNRHEDNRKPPTISVPP